MAMDHLICPITQKFLSRSPNPSGNVCPWASPLRASPTDATCWTTPILSAAHTGTTRAKSAEKFATASISSRRLHFWKFPCAVPRPSCFMLVRGIWRRGEGLKIFLIALFGAMGTLARYGLQGVVQIRTGGAFPYGTLLVNLSGCFLVGRRRHLTLNRMLVSADMRMAIAVGFFGGYTTFSSFGWETAKMLEAGEWLWATTYVAASVAFGLLLSVAGIRLANRF